MRYFILTSAAALAMAVLAPAAAEVAPGPGLVRHDTLTVGDLPRTVLSYVPAHRPPAPALVIALHGGGGSGERMRGFIGHALEPLAEARGFLVAYPDGYQGGWNDCRRAAPYAARAMNIDDASFVRAIAAAFRRWHGVDAARVYAIGFSNGGQLAWRLALEAPDVVAGVGVFGANLPAPEAHDCVARGQPLPVAVVAGTADRVNPYHGGMAIAPAGDSLGIVWSADATAAWVAREAGLDPAAASHAVLQPAGPGRHKVERAVWACGETSLVSLFTVHGGGHTIPRPGPAFPAFLGPTEVHFDGVAAVVDFLLTAAAPEAACPPARTTIASPVADYRW